MIQRYLLTLFLVATLAVLSGCCGGPINSCGIRSRILNLPITICDSGCSKCDSDGVDGAPQISETEEDLPTDSSEDSCNGSCCGDRRGRIIGCGNILTMLGERIDRLRGCRYLDSDCGEMYFGDWRSSPPDYCDPCNQYGEWDQSTCCQRNWFKDMVFNPLDWFNCGSCATLPCHSGCHNFGEDNPTVPPAKSGCTSCAARQLDEEGFASDEEPINNEASSSRIVRKSP